VNIWQRIEIPSALRAGLTAAPTPYRLVKQSEVPARPMTEDPALRDRSSELLAPAMGFLLSRSMHALPPLWRKPTP